jgi:lysophospholipase L1-like esterase
MAAAMVLAFLICELGARLIFPRPPEGTRQPEIGYLLDPEIRYVMAPSQKGWIDEGLVTINALGFRGAEVGLRKPPDRFRVAVIGDSLTLGWGVSDQETYAARLERLLRSRLPDGSIDVLNLGIGGYNTRQEVAFLERHLAALEPDLVLVGFYLNDVPEMLEDTGPSPGRGAQRAGVSQGGRPLRLNPTPSGWWHRQVRRSRLLYIAARAFNRTRGVGEQGRTQFEMEMALLSGVESEQMQRAWDKVAGQFSRLRKLADAHGFAVGIIALPCREQVTGEAQSTAYRDRLRTLADAHAFHTIDPVPVMRERADDGRRLYIPYDRNHPSAEGHALIAQAIYRSLLESGLIAAAPRPARAGS